MRRHYAGHSRLRSTKRSAKRRKVRDTPGTKVLAEFRRQPFPCRLGLCPFEFRQLMPEPGELPLGVMAGVSAPDHRRLLARDLAPEMAHQPRHAMRLHR